jgi:hypothetical protein
VVGATKMDSGISAEAEARLRRKKKQQLSVSYSSTTDPLVVKSPGRVKASWLPFEIPPVHLMLQEFEQFSGIPRFYLFASIFLSFTAIFLHFGGIEKVAAVIGLVFPLYQTFRALELEDEDDEEKRPLWLKYWIVFGFFHFISSYVGDFVLSRVLPFYYQLKIMFVIWLFNSSTGGVHVVYDKVMRPLLILYAKEIGAYIDVAQNKGQEAAGWVASNSAFSPQILLQTMSTVSFLSF